MFLLASISTLSVSADKILSLAVTVAYLCVGVATITARIRIDEQKITDWLSLLSVADEQIMCVCCSILSLSLSCSSGSGSGAYRDMYNLHMHDGATARGWKSKEKPIMWIIHPAPSMTRSLAAFLCCCISNARYASLSHSCFYNLQFQFFFYFIRLLWQNREHSVADKRWCWIMRWNYILRFLW